MAIIDPPPLDLGVDVTVNGTSDVMRSPVIPHARVIIQVRGTGTWTATLQMSLDQEFWANWVAKTSNEIFDVPYSPFYRMVYSGFAAANVTTHVLFQLRHKQLAQ